MAKDRNTIAKRQREADKRRKAEEKRKNRMQRKAEANEPASPNREAAALSSAERKVLELFREYLMTPGVMLCINSPQLEILQEPLKQMTEKGLLVAEQRQGGYSLTVQGYEEMSVLGS